VENRKEHSVSQKKGGKGENYPKVKEKEMFPKFPSGVEGRKLILQGE